MSPLAGAWAAVRLVHPAPTGAVILLSAALGAILLTQAGRSIDAGWGATPADCQITSQLVTVGC